VLSVQKRFSIFHTASGDHPKTAEAIARKINLVIGDTKESLAAKTGRGINEIYDDEVNAVVVHGDDIDGLQGWEWDQSMFSPGELPSLSYERSFQFSARMRLSLQGLHLNTSWKLVRVTAVMEIMADT